MTAPIYKKTKKVPWQKFLIGSYVRICSDEELKTFRKTWGQHTPLQDDQMKHGGKVAKIEDVAMYHGGDLLYLLDGIPGLWHEFLLCEEKK